MRVLIGGSSGLIGTALTRLLREQGHEPMPLLRGGGLVPPDRGVPWDPAAGVLDPAALEGFDAVVHLGGESIQAPRWTAAKKRRIRDTRVQSTRLLAETMAACAAPPPVFLCASAIGYYGDRGEEELLETSAPGTGFMAETCQAWEAAAAAARDAGVRVVHLRIGLVLSRDGGVLPILRRVFRLGLGGVIAGGAMYASWVDLDDLVGGALHCLERSDIEGAVNGVAPHPVTNRELTATLSRVLHRPALAPAPRFAIELALGEMGRELLLSSARVLPGVLSGTDFGFARPTLEGSLRHELS